MKKYNYFLFLILPFLIVSCIGTALPKATPAQIEWANAHWPGTGEIELNQARELYAGRCSSCHNLVPPSEHSLKEWLVLLDEMAERAKITYAQKEILRRYIVVMKEAPAK